MKTQIKSQKSYHQGFTLVELLTVIAIIVILAGLSVAGMGWANSKALKDKTITQLRLLENGLQQYHSDVGSYPAADGKAKDNKPVKGGADSLLVYAMCYGDVEDHGGFNVRRGTVVPNYRWKPNENATVYISELDPNLEGNPWFNRTPDPEGLIDPYGRFWYYRSGQDDNMNPDFDLWSAGVLYKNNNDDKRDDITNW